MGHSDLSVIISDPVTYNNTQVSFFALFIAVFLFRQRLSNHYEESEGKV